MVAAYSLQWKPENSSTIVLHTQILKKDGTPAHIILDPCSSFLELTVRSL